MKGLSFLVIGLAIGFVAATMLYKSEESHKRDADALVDDLEKRFDSLEIEPSHA